MKTQKLKDPAITFSQQNIAEACAYIEDMWQQLTKVQKEDSGTLVGLPYPYIVPSVEERGGFVFEEMYYWDSYFIALGLIESGKTELAEGMLENAIYLFKRFQMIPNASRMYFTSRSQPPLLTTFIFKIYDVCEKNEQWLRERIEIAEREYQTVWEGETQPHIRKVYKGLSRFYDINVLDDLAEAESGWDMTTRFNGKCLSHIPIDLNSLLYKYETDFARAYKIFNDADTSDVWATKAKVRSVNVSVELWNSKKGYFFDLNYETGEHSQVWSLAGLYPLWTGLVSEIQAEKIVNNLSKFIQEGGLATTSSDESDDHRPIVKQWAYPNGWAPLHLVAVEGLEKYGFHEEAELIARKWLKCNLDYFKTFGIFREVYNVVEPLDEPEEGVYPSQSGFGWTNAVFLQLAKKYLTAEEKALI